MDMWWSLDWIFRGPHQVFRRGWGLHRLWLRRRLGIGCRQNSINCDLYSVIQTKTQDSPVLLPAWLMELRIPLFNFVMHHRSSRRRRIINAVVTAVTVLVQSSDFCSTTLGFLEMERRSSGQFATGITRSSLKIECCVNQVVNKLQQNYSSKCNYCNEHTSRIRVTDRQTDRTICQHYG